MVQSQSQIGFSPSSNKGTCTSTMAPKLKMSASSQTPKKRGKQRGRKRQPLPEHPPIRTGVSSADEMVMDLLVGVTQDQPYITST